MNNYSIFYLLVNVTFFLCILELNYRRIIILIEFDVLMFAYNDQEIYNECMFCIIF